MKIRSDFMTNLFIKPCNSKRFTYFFLPLYIVRNCSFSLQVWVCVLRSVLTALSPYRQLETEFRWAKDLVVLIVLFSLFHCPRRPRSIHFEMWFMQKDLPWSPLRANLYCGCWVRRYQQAVLFIKHPAHGWSVEFKSFLYLEALSWKNPSNHSLCPQAKQDWRPNYHKG